jgi:hypothetical protein
VVAVAFKGKGSDKVYLWMKAFDAKNYIEALDKSIRYLIDEEGVENMVIVAQDFLDLENLDEERNDMKKYEFDDAPELGRRRVPIQRRKMVRRVDDGA